MIRKTKKVTLNTVAESIQELARMTAKGFENTATKKNATDLKADVGILQTDVSDIKLRLDNVAHKFEFKELEKRTKRLEDKAGIRHTIRH